jgi:hypothetical protein
MIGHIGCHTAPNAEYLRAIAPGAVEFGFTVFPDFRRQGYAREASVALMTWAHQTHGVSRFVLSIPPRQRPLPGPSRATGLPAGSDRTSMMWTVSRISWNFKCRILRHSSPRCDEVSRTDGRVPAATPQD